MFLSQALCIFAAKVDQLYTPLELTKLVYREPVQQKSVSSTLRRFSTDRCFQGYLDEEQNRSKMGNKRQQEIRYFLKSEKRKGGNGKYVLTCSGGIWKYHCKQISMKESLLFTVIILHMKSESIRRVDELLEGYHLPLSTQEADHFTAQCQRYEEFQKRPLADKLTRYRGACWQTLITPQLKAATLKILFASKADPFLPLAEDLRCMLTIALVERGLSQAVMKKTYVTSLAIKTQKAMKQDQHSSLLLEPNFIPNRSHSNTGDSSQVQKMTAIRWRGTKIIYLTAAILFLGVSYHFFMRPFESETTSTQETRFETILPAVSLPIDV